MKRTVVGTGITQRVVDTYNPNDSEDLEVLNKGWGCAFPDFVAGLVEDATNYLAKKGLPSVWAMYERRDGQWTQLPKASAASGPAFSFRAVIKEEGYADDTQVGCASQIIMFAQFLDAALKAGNAVESAKMAYELGLLVRESVFKHQWERAALRGTKVRAAAMERTAQYNQGRREESGRKLGRWQAEADKIWARHPKLSKQAVAELVRKQLEKNGSAAFLASADWIAKRIRKSGALA